MSATWIINQKTNASSRCNNRFAPTSLRETKCRTEGVTGRQVSRSSRINTVSSLDWRGAANKTQQDLNRPEFLSVLMSRGFQWVRVRSRMRVRATWVSGIVAPWLAEREMTPAASTPHSGVSLSTCTQLIWITCSRPREVLKTFGPRQWREQDEMFGH